MLKTKLSGVEGLTPKGSKAEREIPQACSSAEEAHDAPSESSPATELNVLQSTSSYQSSSHLKVGVSRAAFYTSKWNRVPNARNTLRNQPHPQRLKSAFPGTSDFLGVSRAAFYTSKCFHIRSSAIFEYSAVSASTLIGLTTLPSTSSSNTHVR